MNIEQAAQILIGNSNDYLARINKVLGKATKMRDDWIHLVKKLEDDKCSWENINKELSCIRLGKK